MGPCLTQAYPNKKLPVAMPRCRSSSSAKAAAAAAAGRRLRSSLTYREKVKEEAAVRRSERYASIEAYPSAGGSTARLLPQQRQEQ